MNYKVFRSAVLELLEEDKEWEVETDWGEESCGSSPGSLNGTGADAESVDDFIELEQEKGAIYEFMSVSVGKLFLFYQDEGWDAVVRELERHTRRGRNSLGRNRGIDYTARPGCAPGSRFRNSSPLTLSSRTGRSMRCAAISRGPWRSCGLSTESERRTLRNTDSPFWRKSSSLKAGL